MMKRRHVVLFGACALLVAAAGIVATHEDQASASRDGDLRRYEVAVTNLTRGQIFSPVTLAVHRSKLGLFSGGAAPSEELAAVAEDAVAGPLVDALGKNPNVGGIETIFGAGGPILPGETASVRFTTTEDYNRISFVSMLVITNDAFFGADSVTLPRVSSKNIVVPAYDAGSEANTELCTDIPGPPCENPGVRVTDGAEGYVHIHAGIHGIGDLGAAAYDWRNPVARIHMRRLRD